MQEKTMRKQGKTRPSETDQTRPDHCDCGAVQIMIVVVLVMVLVLVVLLLLLVVGGDRNWRR